MEFVQANWWVIVIAAAIAVALAWWIFVRNRKTRVTTTRPDVLDEGAAPAQRNQALIDAPSAAATPGSVLGRATEPAPAPKPEPVPAPPPAPPPPPATPPPAPKPKAPPKPKAEPKAKAEPKPKAKPAPKPKAAPKPKPAPVPKPEPVAPPAPAPAPPPPAPPPPAPEPAPPPPPPAPKVVAPDELTQIKGLGPKMEALFRDLGVTSFAHIAAWTDADIDRIDPQLGNFEGRIRRDNFVEQAKLLAAGDIAGFEAKFGAL